MPQNLVAKKWPPCTSSPSRNCKHAMPKCSGSPRTATIKPGFANASPGAGSCSPKAIRARAGRGRAGVGHGAGQRCRFAIFPTRSLPRPRGSGPFNNTRSRHWTRRRFLPQRLGPHLRSGKRWPAIWPFCRCRVARSPACSKGRSLAVKVLPQGFEWAGRVFGSLSAVAKAITGQHCSGYTFFKLGKDQQHASPK